MGGLTDGFLDQPCCNSVIIYHEEHRILACSSVLQRKSDQVLGRGFIQVEWDELKRELGKVEKPARYTGGEINAVIKDPSEVSVHFALAFPDVYEVGSSHLGSQILYHVLNKRRDTACERVFAPWPDMEKLLKRKGWLLYSLENRLPLRVFDIVGFSLQYELTYTNVLAMLDAGGIPLESRERGEHDPLVVAGGPCAMAPEPLADFIDAFVLGDGEEVCGEIVETYKSWRESGRSRDHLLIELSRIEGVYVPLLYQVEYNQDGTIEAMVPQKVGSYVPPLPIRRRVLKSLEDSEVPINPVIPLTAPVHDRAMVEIFRGCTQGCRFCQAGMIYRPVREREPDTVDAVARDILARSGYDEVSLTSLSSADYTFIKEVVSSLLTDRPCGARISLPSLRVDSFSVGLAEMLEASPKGGLTLAPEAGSQRMRDAINKKVTEDDVLQAASRAFAAGYSHIKLYFMIGLPGETDEDVVAIADLASKVRQTGRDMGIRPTVVVSVSGFVPKPHTPFQWEACLPVDELERRQRLLKKALRGPGLEFRYHDARSTQLEAVFARGDRRLGAALKEAFEQGRRFDAWSDLFDWEGWLDIFRKTGIDPWFYAHREREKGEVFPWDHIDSGVSREYLWREREKSRIPALTLDCRQSSCTGCGVCHRFGVNMEIATGRRWRK